MAKAKTTRKTVGKATRASSIKKTATSSAAKKVAKPSAGKTTATRSRTPKTKNTEKSSVSQKSPSTEKLTVDRRSVASGRRKGSDRRKSDEPVAIERRALERRAKVNRRRQIDPTTCERDYTNEELEFMNALDEYKRTSGRMFPTCSEVLEVIKSLGYAKLPNSDSDEQPRQPIDVENCDTATALVNTDGLIGINDAENSSWHATMQSFELQEEHHFTERVTF